jgi:AAA+ ATPase superfamily predicted ATPase
MVSKQNIVNPFFTGVQIPDDYFCDRKNETQTIIDLIQNGNNVVLKAQRRIGKSTLIHHIFNQSQIKSNYNTLYIDLFGTKDQNDFHLAFQNKLLNAPFAKTARIKQNFEVLQKGLHISLGEYNPVTGTYSLPSIGSTPSQIPLLPLEELFEYLEQTPKPNIVVFDEFQQVQYYPEKMAAIIRSFTQRMNNTKFIFSGSSKHMLTEMFQIANQPFY